MSGYEPGRTRYLLVFEDAKLDGLEVAAYTPPVGVLEEVVKLISADSDDADMAAAGFELIKIFAGYIAEWNVTAGGVPVPATYAGLRTLEAPFVTKIIKAWVEAMVEPDPKLPAPSSDGSTSAEGQPPGLASASRSLPSS